MIKNYRKCLLMGLNYTGTNSELSGCINDMENLSNLLLENNYCEKSQIILMNDQQKELLYPNKANIWYQFKQLIKYTKSVPKTETVHLFIAYSGHGSYIKDQSNDELDTKDEVWCPLDYSNSGFIKDEEIRSRFIDVLPHNVNLILLSDSCHSGTIADLRYSYQLDENNAITVQQKYVDTKCNILCISGCRDNQVSADTYLIDTQTNKYEYQGAMTASLIANYNNNISCGQLVKKMKSWLKEKGYQQIPELSSGKKINTNSKFLLPQSNRNIEDNNSENNNFANDNLENNNFANNDIENKKI